MQYVSIDIETTGLDPSADQILQIAAVADVNPQIAVGDLPFIDLKIRRDRVSGHPFAMAMNAKLLRFIADDDEEKFTVTPFEAEARLRDFIRAHFKERRVTAAGKNFASFDRQFIKRMNSPLDRLFHHRSIDPAMFFIEPFDTIIPDSRLCGTRAGFPTELNHDALEDARHVVSLVRIGMARLAKAPSCSA